MDLTLLSSWLPPWTAGVVAFLILMGGLLWVRTIGRGRPHS